MVKRYPLDHPLGSAQLKARWANIHIRRLELAIRAAERSPHFAFTEQRRVDLPGVPEIPTEGGSIFALTIDPAVSQRWALIIGDVLTNLRASLDHLAWGLSVLYSEFGGGKLTDSKRKQIHFPLRWSPVPSAESFIGGLNRNDIRFMPPSSHTIVERFQPYNRTARPEFALLGALGVLVDEDKHRVVTPVFREARFRLLPDDPNLMRSRVNQPTAHLFMVTDAQRDDVKPEVAFDVVLDVPLLFPDTFSVSDFRRLYRLISHELIPAFGALWL